MLYQLVGVIFIGYQCTYNHLKPTTRTTQKLVVSDLSDVHRTCHYKFVPSLKTCPIRLHRTWHCRSVPSVAILKSFSCQAPSDRFGVHHTLSCRRHISRLLDLPFRPLWYCVRWHIEPMRCAQLPKSNLHALYVSSPEGGLMAQRTYPVCKAPKIQKNKLSECRVRCTPDQSGALIAARPYLTWAQLS